MIGDIFTALFLLIGGFFALVAAAGIWRFQDFYARVHAATKASTFGFGFTVVAVAIQLATWSGWLKALAAILFLFVTLPVAAHLLSRAVKSKEQLHADKVEE